MSSVCIFCGGVIPDGASGCLSCLGVKQKKGIDWSILDNKNKKAVNGRVFRSKRKLYSCYANGKYIGDTVAVSEKQALVYVFARDEDFFNVAKVPFSDEYGFEAIPIKEWWW